MGLSLTIEEGRDQGRQFSFDQPQVAIGRTVENDLVLTDIGVSRRHAVIRCEGGRFFVQDMGSANGTQVNGSSITDSELHDGDIVAVGTVLLSLALQESVTRTVTSREREAERMRRGALVKRSDTRIERTEPVAIARRPGATALPKAFPVPGGARPKPRPSPLLASERARIRRENPGPLGWLKVWYLQSSRRVRIAALGGAALVVFVLVLAAIHAQASIRPAKSVRGDRSRDTFPLGEQPSKDVYGVGDGLGVTVQTRDEVHFELEYAESIPVVYYVKFEAHGIERDDEVEISLNGVHVGYVTHGIGDYTKAQRVKLPKRHLKAGGLNEVVFDNAYNPPQSAPWAISKVRLVVKVIPQCAPDECLVEAKKLYDLADTRLAQKDIAAANRYDAWSALHRGLLFLEAVEPKPDLYNLAQAALRDVDRDLENLCNKIMLSAKRAEELHDAKRALEEYRNGLTWFPKADDEHPCRGRLQEKIDEYGDVGPGGR